MTFLLFFSKLNNISNSYLISFNRDGEEFYEQFREFLIQWVPSYRTALNSAANSATRVSNIRDMDFNSNAMYDSLQAQNSSNAMMDHTNRSNRGF